MSAEVEAAIEETASKAKQLLFDRKGKLKGPEARIALYTMQIALPKARAAQVLSRQEGQTFFDWQGDTRVYNAGVGDLLISLAADDPFFDRVVCCSAAIMLDALGGIPHARLRSYIGARLTTGLPALEKRKRGQRKADNTYRDMTIAYHLILPLLDRFNATRNEATKQKDETESACSIVTKALERAKIHMSEKTVEDIWGKLGPVLARS
jgi:hypothetical protein